MHAVNGRADLEGPRHELGDYLPMRKEVTLNGQTYLGWKIRDGCYPREILARLGRAYRRYYRVIAPLVVPRPVWMCPECQTKAIRTSGVVCEHDGSEFPLEFDLWLQERAADEAARDKASDDQDLAYAAYLTESVLACVPGTLESDVALVPAEKLEELLRDLEYFERNPPAPPTKTGGSGADESLPLTGDSSPLDSPVSTESIQTAS